MLKRAFDLVLAVSALIFLSPLIVTLAIAVRVVSGSPVLFRQMRPGLHGKPFYLVKFRTMVPAPPAADLLLLDDGPRLTSIGRFLRATSLDELPELWNVVRGDMSLVGPRPLLMEYLDRYTPAQARRHQVRPGMTGLAQVQGRNALSWERKLELDAQYVATRSLALDLRLLLKTLHVVLTRSDISAEGCATAPVFLGTTSGPSHSASAPRT